MRRTSAMTPSRITGETARTSTKSTFAGLLCLFSQQSQPKKKGSSPNTGEGGSNLEEEVVGIAETAGHSLDDLDLVVDAFQEAGVQRPPAVSGAVLNDP